VIVVLDTSVWVSGLQFGGTPDRALNQALTVDQLAISDFIRNEILRILLTKFRWNRPELITLLDELLIRALVVEVRGEIAGVCRDANDDAILETAWRAGADLLVSGDKDLLSLGTFRGVSIVTSSEYVKNV